MLQKRWINLNQQTHWKSKRQIKWHHTVGRMLVNVCECWLFIRVHQRLQKGANMFANNLSCPQEIWIILKMFRNWPSFRHSTWQSLCFTQVTGWQRFQNTFVQIQQHYLTSRKSHKLVVRGRSIISVTSVSMSWVGHIANQSVNRGVVKTKSTHFKQSFKLKCHCPWCTQISKVCLNYSSGATKMINSCALYSFIQVEIKIGLTG